MLYIRSNISNISASSSGVITVFLLYLFIHEASIQTSSAFKIAWDLITNSSSAWGLGFVLRDLLVNILYYTEHPAFVTFIEYLYSWRKEEKCQVLSWVELSTQQVLWTFQKCSPCDLYNYIWSKHHVWLMENGNWLQRSVILNPSFIWELPKQFHKTPLPEFHTKQLSYNCFTIQPGHYDV